MAWTPKWETSCAQYASWSGLIPWVDLYSLWCNPSCSTSMRIRMKMRQNLSGRNKQQDFSWWTKTIYYSWIVRRIEGKGLTVWQKRSALFSYGVSRWIIVMGFWGRIFHSLGTIGLTEIGRRIRILSCSRHQMIGKGRISPSIWRQKCSQSWNTKEMVTSSS